MYIFFERRDARKFTCLTAKFQEEAIEPLREMVNLWYMTNIPVLERQEMLVNKLDVDVLLLMLCRLRFCKSF